MTRAKTFIIIIIELVLGFTVLYGAPKENSLTVGFYIAPYFGSIDYDPENIGGLFSARKVEIELVFDKIIKGKDITIGVGGTGAWQGENYNSYYVWIGKNIEVITIGKFVFKYKGDSGVAYNATQNRTSLYNDNSALFIYNNYFGIRAGVTQILFTKDTYVRHIMMPHIGIWAGIGL